MREAKAAPRDEELVEAAQAGTPAAFEELTRRHFGLVYVIARAHLDDSARAEDLAQEAFLRAWLHLGRLRRPFLFSAWISRLARNMAIDWLRRDQRRSRLIQLVPLGPEAHARADATAEGTREMMIAAEERSAVQAALFQLPPAQRELVLLHFAEGLSQREIAARLGVNSATVNRRIRRALRTMRGTLEPLIRSTAAEFRAPSGATGRAVCLIGAAAALSASQRAALAAVAGPLAIRWLGWGAARTPVAVGVTALGLLIGGWVVLQWSDVSGQMSVGSGQRIDESTSQRVNDGDRRPEAEAPFTTALSGRASTVDDEAFLNAEAAFRAPAVTTRLWGRVMDDRGVPIPEAVVILTQVESTHGIDRPALHATRTDFDGFYEIEDFQRIGQRLQITARSPRRAQITRRIPDTPPPSLRVDLALPPGRVVTGRVVWADGRPVARARLGAYTPIDDNWSISEGQADERGEFRLAGLPPIAYLIDVAPEGGVSERAGEHQANEDNLVIRLAMRTGVIEGQTVGQFTGRPLPDRTLWLDDTIPTVADSEGRFRFENVSLEQHTVVWRLGERGQSWGAGLSETEPHLDATFAEPEPMPISGTVVDAETGEPVGGLGLVLRSVNQAVVVTDGQGRFRCDDVIVGSRLETEVASGEWIMEGREHEEEPFRILRIERAEDLNAIRFAVRRGVPLDVRVIDAAGAPLPGAALWRWAPAQGSRVPLGTADALGRWHGIRPAGLGEFRVIGAHRDHALLLSPMLGPTATEVRVEPVPAVDVSVRVVDPRGAPLPAVGVTAILVAPFGPHGMNPPGGPRLHNDYRLSPSEDPRDHCLTDLDGRVTLSGLPRMPHHLWAETSTGAFASTEVDLTSGSSPIPVTIRIAVLGRP